MSVYIIILLLCLILGIQIYCLIESKAIEKKLMKSVKEVEYKQDITFTQLQCYFNIISLLSPRAMLPEFRNGWSVSPDFGAILLKNIFSHKPNTIVELGSGVSTIITGYALQKIGIGKLYSLDHDKEFLMKTNVEIGLHKLQSTIETLQADLIPYENEGEKFMWYDLKKLPPEMKIDMLIVDGPPGFLQPLSRYLAIPLLWDRLSDNAIILVDDAKRKDEEECINQWVAKYSLKYTKFDTETGTVVLQKPKLSES